MDEPSTFRIDKNLGMGETNLTLDSYMAMMADLDKIHRDTLVLIVMHPADIEQIPKANKNDFPNFNPGSWVGTETWPRPQIKRGRPHIYKSWATAIMGLKEILPHSDMVELVRRLKSQAVLRKEAIDSEVALAAEIILKQKDTHKK